MIQSLPVDIYASPTTITDGENSLEYYMKPVSLSIKTKYIKIRWKIMVPFKYTNFGIWVPFIPFTKIKIPHLLYWLINYWLWCQHFVKIFIKIERRIETFQICKNWHFLAIFGWASQKLCKIEVIYQHIT